MSEVIDNRARRIRQLKEIIVHLHQGLPPDEVRRRLAELVRETNASEIAAMEQELIAEGMTIDEVRSMCDLHADVVRDVNKPVHIRPRIAPGHPVDTFQRENAALGALVADLRAALAGLVSPGDGADQERALLRCRGLANQLFDVDRHYQRKELLLFSCLERHGITGPSKVMWAKDDEARALVKDLSAALDCAGPSNPDSYRQAAAAGDRALAAVEGMIQKEERILLPLALDTLTREEWGQIWRESPRIGWCLVEPAAGYEPPASMVPADTLDVPGGRAMVFPTGHLTFDQLWSLFRTLPVDLTFVDADDRVAFYSEGPSRLFARSKAVIGRKVQHCHPPGSVSVVDRILDDFRSGRQSVAEFWIDFHGRFAHIRYFAVRDEAQHYLGCLEVTQDVTRIRALQGERRLLEYEGA